ncbi:MAG: radical SAM protein [Thermococci archaeon]|nr:radical SAM protein [Thermococci archaeon]
MRVVLIDAYTDEPAGLGVPPYLGIYPRYAYGAVKTALPEADVTYLTVDEVRLLTGRGPDPDSDLNVKKNLTATSVRNALNRADVVVWIGGLHTPGKYLSAVPGSLKDAEELFKGGVVRGDAVTVLGGPTFMGSALYGGMKVRSSDIRSLEETFDYVVSGDLEAFLHDLVSRGDADTDRMRSYDELRDYATKGAEVVLQHPGYPDRLIIEIETQRGCPKAMGIGGCSFCTEPVRYPTVENRPIEDVAAEVGAIYRMGVRRFRLGRQSCIFSYMAEPDGRVPVPNPDAVVRLFREVRRAAPDPLTLHADNANPAVIANYPGESEIIARAMVRYGTPGNVVAFGLESADPEVARINNLNATPEETREAVRLLNRIGGVRGPNGMPWLLPGINLLFGLPGERKRSYELTFEFLRSLLDEGLMVRRINIRQVVVFPGTPLWNMKTRVDAHKRLFQHYKYKIRHEIDLPMLRRVVPAGTILRGVLTEVHRREKGLTYGRQIGSYPILVGIPKIVELGRFYNVMVVDHGFRSVTGLVLPIDVNRESPKILRLIPGIGRKKLAEILRNRPFRSPAEFFAVAGDQVRKLLEGNVLAS